MMAVVQFGFKKALNFFKSFFSKKETVVVANKEAIEKMEEFNNNLTNKKIAQLEKQLEKMANDIQLLIELEKASQEFILYLCTTNEELLNLLSGEEINVMPAEEETFEDELLKSHWNIKKGGNILN